MQILTSTLPRERIQPGCRNLDAAGTRCLNIESHQQASFGLPSTRALDPVDTGRKAATRAKGDIERATDVYGTVRECWCECKAEMKRPAFWVLNLFLMFLLFPLEHALYTHVAPFSWLTRFLGLD